MSSARLDDHDHENDDPRTPLLKTPPAAVLSKSPEWIASAFQNWFGWELISAVVAVVSLGAVAGVLAAYDGSSLPDWPSAITVCFLFPENPMIVAFFWKRGRVPLLSVVISFLSEKGYLDRTRCHFYSMMASTPSPPTMMEY